MKTMWYLLALSLSIILHASLLLLGDPTQNPTLPMDQGHATLQLNLVASIASPPPEPPEVFETPHPPPEAQQVQHEPMPLSEPVVQPVRMSAPVIEQVKATLPVKPKVIEQPPKPPTPAPPTPETPITPPRAKAPQTKKVTEAKTPPKKLPVTQTPPTVQKPSPVAIPTVASVDANTDPQPQGVTTQAQLRDPVRPVYPFFSRRRGEEGTVIVQVHVTAQGHADSVKVLHSSGFSRLDKAALKACGQARYLPAIKKGKRISTSFNFKVRFQLQNNS